jgi:hypothetical protein
MKNLLTFFSCCCIQLVASSSRKYWSEKIKRVGKCRVKMARCQTETERHGWPCRRDYHGSGALAANEFPLTLGKRLSYFIFFFFLIQRRNNEGNRSRTTVGRLFSIATPCVDGPGENYPPQINISPATAQSESRIKTTTTTTT